MSAGIFGPSKSSLEKRRAELESRVLKAKKGLREREADLERALSLYGADSKETDAARKGLASSAKRASASEEALMQERFRRAVGILGLDLEPHEVAAMATMSALLGLLVGAFIAATLALAVELPIGDAALYASCGGLAGAVAGYYLASSYPYILAKRARMRSLGKSPEAVCYMVMSLNLVPSLERAVVFASENSEEPLATALRRVIWDVYSREFVTVEDSFVSFANGWTGENEELKMSLYALRGAVSERTPEGRARVLEKATDMALTGTRRRIEEFAAGLSGPATILFALGILLPLVVGSMLPLMAVGSLDVGSIAGGLAMRQNPRVSLVVTLVLMDAVFPLAAFAYAYMVIGRRPGASSSEIPLKGGNPAAIPAMLGALMLAVGFFFALREEELLRVAGALLALGGVDVSLGLYFHLASSERKRARDRALKMEGEFPDALFQLGRRVAEGVPLEGAFEKVGSSMRGSEIGALFVRIASTVRASGLPLERALFDPDVGALREVRSRTVIATLKTVISSAEMDPSAAGKMMMEFSGYLRDLRKADQDIRLQLSGVSENMRSTATLFAPLIMGVTVGLYALLSHTFEGLGGGGMMPVWLFAAVVGVYLAMMVAVISYFCSRLLYGEDGVELRSRIGKSLITSWVVFSAATLVAYLGFA